MDVKVALAILTIVAACYAYPNGAPPNTCGSVRPGHGRKYSNNNYKYSLSCDIVGNRVYMTIRGRIPFKGLLAQMRINPRSPRYVGRYYSTGVDSRYYKPSCRSRGVTHRTNSFKRYARFISVMNFKEIAAKPYCLVTIVVDKSRYVTLARYARKYVRKG